MPVPARTKYHQRGRTTHLGIDLQQTSIASTIYERARLSHSNLTCHHVDHKGLEDAAVC
ncbi:hypothetical protein SCLCIDRAFT_1215988 [Scleroderma citrinum Foug A]|uniref:Uncharacterized protein n=1 Tax=Scleroderma citrinum Foug A TaxID=1036808 RepID=A0A0C3DZ76_9AGAM|nr:hypothetical protein SCLCIDRAFT_1215988 [Scleroderma citrinum Foug A]